MRTARERLVTAMFMVSLLVVVKESNLRRLTNHLLTRYTRGKIVLKLLTR